MLKEACGDLPPDERDRLAALSIRVAAAGLAVPPTPPS